MSAKASDWAAAVQAEEDRPLKREELERVPERLQAFVQAQWAVGRDVPYGVVWVNNDPATEDEELWLAELVRAGR